MWGVKEAHALTYSLRSGGTEIWKTGCMETSVFGTGDDSSSQVGERFMPIHLLLEHRTFIEDHVKQLILLLSTCLSLRTHQPHTPQFPSKANGKNASHVRIHCPGYSPDSDAVENVATIEASQRTRLPTFFLL